jgi:methionine aminopeptidase
LQEQYSFASTFGGEYFTVYKNLIFQIDETSATGKNTLAIYPDNPPNRTIEKDDILFIDFGPIVEGYEADIVRTYVLGNNPRKLKLKNDIEAAWYDIQEWYQQKTTLKASELFQYAVGKAEELGWEFAGEIAGHIVGKSS